jgi:hypothetical protein
MFGRHFLKIEAILHEVADDMTAFAAFPLRALEEDLESRGRNGTLPHTCYAC